MKKLSDWRAEKNLSGRTDVSVDKQGLAEVCLDYFGSVLRGNMKTIREFVDQNLLESIETSRYSVEVNYRTTGKDALDGFAKICLGYVSAAMKKHGYHTKHVFTEKPIRLLVSSRNWDDGTWTGCVTWNPEHKCFVLSRGFYNKDRKTLSIQKSDKCTSDSAAEITRELVNMMHHLKGQPDRHIEKMKPVPLKRGPKS
jgi:hypothetical protein